MQCKTREQVAKEYGISTKTLSRKLAAKGIDLPKGLIFPRWQKLIYQQLGWPDSLDQAKYDSITTPDLHQE